MKISESNLPSFFPRFTHLFAGVLLIIGSALILHSCIDNPLRSNDDEEQQEQQDDDDNEDDQGSYDSARNPGASSADLLTDERFTHVAVEIDYMAGSAEPLESFEPPQDSFESLENFLAGRIHKNAIIFRTPTEIPAGVQETYTLDNLKQLEEEHRNHYTAGDSDTLQVYLLVVDTRYEGSDVLSTSYYNTSIAFFGTAIADACVCEGAAPPETVDATLLQHEFGHLMGLVTDESHQSEDGRHCTVVGCLMHADVVMKNYYIYVIGEDGDIPKLDAECVGDLQEQGGR